MWVCEWVRRNRERKRKRSAGLDWEFSDTWWSSIWQKTRLINHAYTNPPPPTNTMASTLMGCPFDVKPSTHTPCHSIHGCYMMIVNTYTCFPSSSLYGKILKCRQLAPGQWTQWQGSALLCQALSCQILYQLSQAGARGAGTRAQRVFCSS